MSWPGRHTTTTTAVIVVVPLAPQTPPHQLLDLACPDGQTDDELNQTAGYFGRFIGHTHTQRHLNWQLVVAQDEAPHVGDNKCRRLVNADQHTN